MPIFDFTAPDGRTFSVEGPEGATQEQAFQILQTQLGSAQPQASLGDDLAKSAGAGLANATAGTLGMVGDLRELRNAALGGLANKIGIPQSVQDTIASASKYLPPEMLTNRFPTSQDILKSASDPIVDPNYKPQTVAGGYAKTTAEFLPGMLVGGPRDLGKRLLTNVAAPALASETAGQITQGTEAEPYARVGGALLGGAGATRFANRAAEARALKAATPSLADVKSEATTAYDALTARNVATPLAQSTLDNLADDIIKTLNNRGIRPSTAASIHAAVDEIRTPANALSGVSRSSPASAPGLPDVADLVAARQSIKGLLGSPDANKAGAFIALGKIERAIEQASSGTMAKIREADKNYAASKAVESLDRRVAKAELQAAGEHSGQNVGNKIRQQVTSFLNSSEAKYLDAATKADLEKIVRGTAGQNALRQIANLLGGGGGLGMLAGGAVGYQAGDLPGAVAGAALGRGAKILNNRSVLKQAEGAAQNIRMRSPLGQLNPAALPAPDSVSLAALRAALLARPKQ